MSDRLHHAVDHAPVKLLRVHDQVTTRLDDPERVLEVRPVFRLQIPWTGFALFPDIVENPSVFLAVVAKIGLKITYRVMSCLLRSIFLNKFRKVLF